MSKFVRFKTDRQFSKTVSPYYVNLEKEIKKFVGDVGGLPTLVASVNGMSGTVIIDKDDVTLGNVDNTSDLNKPISTATQTALDLKENKYITINEFASTRILQLSDTSTLINMSAASSVEIPTNASIPFPIGAQVLVMRLGVDAVNITAQVGVTIVSAGNLVNLASQYSVACLIKIATDTWLLTGDLA